jgi:hypothetical protein
MFSMLINLLLLLLLSKQPIHQRGGPGGCISGGVTPHPPLLFPKIKGFLLVPATENMKPRLITIIMI